MNSKYAQILLVLIGLSLVAGAVMYVYLVYSESLFTTAVEEVPITVETTEQSSDPVRDRLEAVMGF